VLAHLLGGALLVATADRPCSELIFDGALGACTERPTVYSASCGGTRELPTRHREPPAPSVQRGYPHRLGGGPPSDAVSHRLGGGHQVTRCHTGLVEAASLSTAWVLVATTGCAGGSAALPPRQ